jgi:hypothetical protein
MAQRESADPYWGIYQALNEAHYRLSLTLVKLSGCAQAGMEVPADVWEEVRERLRKWQEARGRLLALMPAPPEKKASTECDRCGDAGPTRQVVLPDGSPLLALCPGCVLKVIRPGMALLVLE